MSLWLVLVLLAIASIVLWWIPRLRSKQIRPKRRNTFLLFGLIIGLGLLIGQRTVFAAVGNPDLNSDNIIDIVDIMLVSRDFDTTNLAYDFDGNGIIDAADIIEIAQRWHTRGAFIANTSPLQSERDIAVTRETIITFSDPIEPSDITDATIYAMFSGKLLTKRLHISPDNRRVTLFYDDPLPASAQIEVFIDGDNIHDASGYALDADGNGNPGGLGVRAFDTLSLTAFPGTAVCGRVYASELGVDPYGNPVDAPLEGATITVDGKEDELFTTTDDQGEFCLDPAPAGRFFVHVDGRTATNTMHSTPAGSYYPFVGKPWESTIGESIDVGVVHLPLVIDGTLQPVSDVSDTVIHFPQDVIDDYPEFADVTITVSADSLFADDGTRGGMVGIAPVPPDRLPGTLPPDLDFPLVITVQTNGPTNFDTPAGVCFPNLPDPVTGTSLPPGDETALWSFNHDVGTWQPVRASDCFARRHTRLH